MARLCSGTIEVMTDFLNVIPPTGIWVTQEYPELQDRWKMGEVTTVTLIEYGTEKRRVLDMTKGPVQRRYLDEDEVRALNLTTNPRKALDKRASAACYRTDSLLSQPAGDDWFGSTPT
jgi:hypothetical protein